MSGTSPRISLPPAPAAQQRCLDDGRVACWRQEVEIMTYEPDQPDAFPMFFDRRVYQGSDGGVYPLPFISRIAAQAHPKAWQAVHLENRWVRLMLLPELGGRIHIGLDKTRDYDFFYRNNVIKPALVGLAGPWISGGVEFNWPQHHRPATYLPVQTEIEQHPDGSVTVWHSDLDPLQRMRGTHGIRLHPDSSAVELVVRLLNRTDEPQTFLWWANVAAAVHEDYQSFFPVDVRFVADHARRAITAFPQADRPYYGVDYPELARARAGADRIDRYTNIPVPTSYMITDTQDAFFGGYDHRAAAGFVHWADPGYAPGKKQWTWGNGPIGHAWDRQLTDGDGPYVELMAGVFTDNQPDFSHLRPGETREFTQRWYPIQDIGVAHQAGPDAAISVAVEQGRARIGLAVARRIEATVTARHAGDLLLRAEVTVEPGRPWLGQASAPGCTGRDDLVVEVVGADGESVVTWRAPTGQTPVPWQADAPPVPGQIATVDELLVVARHLAQYRHPTRSPRPYLEQALTVDPGDSRTHLALAELEHRCGRYEQAHRHTEAAAARIIARNLNPRSGELYYRQALVLERLGRDTDAVPAFARATWDGAHATAGHLGAARVLLRTGAADRALDHARRAVAVDPANPVAAGVVVLCLERLGRGEEAAADLERARRRDPLDPFLAALDGSLEVVDPRTYLSMAQELTRLGGYERALHWAARAAEVGVSGFGNPAPVAHYLRAMILEKLGDRAGSRAARQEAAQVRRDLAFPSGLDDLDVLSWAVRAADQDRAGSGGPGESGEPVDSGDSGDSGDSVALGLLGTWLLGARRGPDALATLRTAIEAGSTDPVVWRNAAIAVANLEGDLEQAEDHLARAVEIAGPVAQLVFERDQLARLRRVPASERLEALRTCGVDPLARHDLAVAYVGLLLDEQRVDEAEQILRSHVFQPFEGGEGLVIAAFDRTCLALAERTVGTDPAGTAARLDQGIDVPENLGEGRHPADTPVQRLVVAGDAHAAAGHPDLARARWLEAAQDGGALAVAARPARPADLWIGIAHCRLGRPDLAEPIWDALEEAAEQTQKPSAPDYFATSLPDLLLFDVDDVAGRRERAEALRAAAARGRALTAPVADAVVEPVGAAVNPAGAGSGRAGQDDAGEQNRGA